MDYREEAKKHLTTATKYLEDAMEAIGTMESSKGKEILTEEYKRLNIELNQKKACI